MTNIHIDSASEEKATFGNKVTIIDGKNKYIFYSTKKDGSVSRAYEQWQKYGFKVGDGVQAEIAEEQKSFPDKKTGKTITYTERKIIYFNEVEDTPVITSAGGKGYGGGGSGGLGQPLNPVVSREEFEALKARVEALEVNQVADIEAEYPL